MAQWVGTAVLPAPLYSAQSMSIAIKHANNTLLHLRQQQGRGRQDIHPLPAQLSDRSRPSIKVSAGG